MLPTPMPTMVRRSSDQRGRLPPASELMVIRSGGTSSRVRSTGRAHFSGSSPAVKSTMPPFRANLTASSCQRPMWVGRKCQMGRSVASSRS